MIDKRPLLATIALAFLICPVVSGAQAVPEIYLYANDFVGVLTYDEIGMLDEICYELDQVTSDEIAIVIVNTTQPEGINLFAVELFEESGIGKEDLDNGVLILVSTDEGLWRIEVGYGLEGILNDAKVGDIGRENLEPYLADGDYYPGIFYTLAALVTELTNDPDRINEDGYDVEFFRLDYWQLALAISVIIVVGVLTKGRVFFWIGGIITRGRFGGGRSGGGGAKGRF
ncbi:MAG: TPM domain-containing protein [Candidatus Thermoplasmatota archaeon]|nr:TPM domain-containing protein [Candidatus Thermoplasmatota archaeon]